MNNRKTLVLWIFSVALFPSSAYAYLDPGSGGALIQAVLGGLAALGVILKLYWYRILRFLGLRKGHPAGMGEAKGKDQTSKEE